MNELLKSKIIVTQPKAPRFTIIGPPGIGKTTLASQFPDSLFLLTEEPGLIGLTAFPVAKSYKEFKDNINLLYAENNLPFKTLVIDSVTKLDVLIIEAIKNEAGTRNLSTAFGGYGAGHDRVADEHREVRKVLNLFQEKGITVVCIGHLAQAKVDQPDKKTFYRFSIEMGREKCRSPYIDDCEAVFFCKQDPYLEGDEDQNKKNDPNKKILNKGISKPYIITDFDGIHHAKSRFKKYGMPPKIEMNVESIMKYIPFYNPALESTLAKEKA